MANEIIDDDEKLKKEESAREKIKKSLEKAQSKEKTQKIDKIDLVTNPQGLELEKLEELTEEITTSDFTISQIKEDSLMESERLTTSENENKIVSSDSDKRFEDLKTPEPLIKITSSLANNSHGRNAPNLSLSNGKKVSFMDEDDLR